ncbi:MAG TPA: arsenate reductase (glutaredoxin), partial [Alphaproteobacteria bacterium]|nr:arsenate reductase (glutaredoxin) [Alphaproteobacteria bacterium]
MSVKIYHNPRCSKSRQTLALLEEKGVSAEVIEYLKTPPSTEELSEIL